MALFQANENHLGVASILVWRGAALLAAGNAREAEAAYLECLRIYREIGNKQRMANGLEALAELMLSRGQLERAARLLGAAAQTQASMEVAPFPLPPHLAAQREQVIARARQELGEAAWEAAVAAGGALTLDEALAEAFTPIS